MIPGMRLRDRDSRLGSPPDGARPLGQQAKTLLTQGTAKPELLCGRAGTVGVVGKRVRDSLQG